MAVTLQTLRQHHYVDSILDATAEFYNGCSRAQRIALITTSGVVSVCSLLIIKDYYTQRQLRAQGFRRGDISAQLFYLSNEMGASSTVCGFEVCSDSLTVDHAKILARGLMRNFINFRSQIYSFVSLSNC